MIALMAIRFVLACILLVVGVSYLIKTNAYADILMNGVSLGFIAEISEVLFALALREEVKDKTEDIKAIKVEMYGIDWLNRRPALIDTMVVIERGAWCLRGGESPQGRVRRGGRPRDGRLIS